jgi:hypothetical protein
VSVSIATTAPAARMLSGPSVPIPDRLALSCAFIRDWPSAFSLTKPPEKSIRTTSPSTITDCAESDVPSGNAVRTPDDSHGAGPSRRALTIVVAVDARVGNQRMSGTR